MNKIREFRFFKSISQDVLAKRSGVDQSTISRIERSARRALPHHKRRIAKALNTPVKDIFGNS